MQQAKLPVYDSATLPIPLVHEAKELVRYRHLLRNLISRDLKVRYKRSALGFAWTMLNPLLTMLVLAFVFSFLFRRVENYPIYVLSGLITWRFFRQGTMSAMSSILSSRRLLNKIYIPTSALVAATVGGAFVHFGLAIGVLLLLTLPFGVSPHLSWLFLPVPVIQVVLFTFGVSLIVAALAVFFVDLLDIVEVSLNAYYYLTPIIYPISILPPFLQQLQRFNPMFYLVNNFRIVLLEGQLPPALDIILASLASLTVLLVGWIIFTKLSGQFAYRA